MFYLDAGEMPLLKKRPLYKGLVRAPLKPKEQVLRKGVYKKLAKLRAGGHQLAIASNMVTVAHGMTTMKEAERLMADAASKVGGRGCLAVLPLYTQGPQEDPWAKEPLPA